MYALALQSGMCGSKIKRDITQNNDQFCLEVGVWW
jgi:hypothetical protein